MTESKNAPSARAYVVREWKDGTGKKRSEWLKVGPAWLHADGKGFNIDLVPGIAVSGRLVLRAITPKGETIDPETGEVLDKGD